MASKRFPEIRDENNDNINYRGKPNCLTLSRVSEDRRKLLKIKELIRKTDQSVRCLSQMR